MLKNNQEFKRQYPLEKRIETGKMVDVLFVCDLEVYTKKEDLQLGCSDQQLACFDSVSPFCKCHSR